MQGWIKVHRKLLTSEVFRNEKLLKIFMYCLLKATHTDHDFLVGKQIVSLSPGQFVFGRKKAAQELEMNESTVRDYMNVLKKQSIIDIKSTNKYSVITIVNWGFYQTDDEKPDSKHANKMTTEYQQNDTYKNVKNEKNEKEDINTLCHKSQTYDEGDTCYQLAVRFVNKIRSNNPSFKEPDLQKWSKDIRLMLERDSRTEKQVAELIDWSQNNSFWKSNILSPDKLRKKFDQLLMKSLLEKEKTKGNSKRLSHSSDSKGVLAPFFLESETDTDNQREIYSNLF